jgi:hypothetical protein
VIAETRGERLKRHRQFSGIDAKARQRTTGAENTEGAFESGLPAESFDCNVHAPAIGLGVVNNKIRAHALRHGSAHWIGFDSDDKTGTFELCSCCGTQSYRPLREDRYGVTDLYVCAFCGRNSGGGNVSQQNNLLIA